LIVNAREEVIGQVTSGGFAQAWARPLAMGYVQSEYTALETEVFAQVRGKLVPMQVVRTPSWPHVTTAVEQEPADEPAPASRGGNCAAPRRWRASR
jgi:glycine cleavage system aminomethyltransferase T